MSREKKKIDFKVANSLADIFNDKTNSFYEVFLKPVNGHTIKRYLAKGTLNKYGHNRDEIQCYTKTGQLVWSYRNGMKSFIIPNGVDYLTTKSLKVRCNYSTYNVYLSKEEAYNTVINNLRKQKLDINKQIIELQNELYSVK
jgi:hypothetical protein